MTVNFKSYLTIASLSIAIATSGCSEGKKVQSATIGEKISDDTSMLVIPITLIEDDFEKNINQNIPGMLYEDSNLEDDGLVFRASKRNAVELEFYKDRIAYRVPINLWFRKNLLLTSATGTGALVLDFNTKFDVDADWNLHTRTDVVGYRWLETPEVNVGFASIPITPIVDHFLERSKSQIASSIDALIREQFNLRQNLETAWKQLQQPIFLSEEYSTWLLIEPQKLSLSPIVCHNDSISLVAYALIKPKLFVGEKPLVANTTHLPALERYAPKSDGFSVKIKAKVDIKEATRISKKNLAGEYYAFGKRKVRLDDISLSGKGNQLVVRTTLSGSYNGDVEFIGKPSYNLSKNQIRIEKLQVDFSSNKHLLKTAAWLFKSKLVQEIESTLNSYLEKYLNDLYVELGNTLNHHVLAPGIVLTGKLGNIELSNLYVSTDAINFQVALSGKSMVIIGR